MGGTPASQSLTSEINSLTGTGQPIPQQVRGFFEPRFGTDFGKVRIHTDSWAAASASKLNAHAYTYGKDIVFGNGQYDTNSIAGKSLLAHELAHVVQQDGLSADSCPIQRTGANCPSDWKTTVDADHERALTMLDVARGKLSSYDGTNPPEVKTALATHFKSTGVAFAAWVNLNLGFLRLMAPLANYDCEDKNSWWCDDAAAKTFWCVPLIDIRVCYPWYFSGLDKDRSEILIHEWVHKYGCNFDLGYRGSSGYQDQWTITALLNADPFSEFVKDVS